MEEILHLSGSPTVGLRFLDGILPFPRYRLKGVDQACFHLQSEDQCLLKGIYMSLV